VISLSDPRHIELLAALMERRAMRRQVA